MKILITADLHLTDKAKDSYRWDFFPWLKNTLITENISRLIILGDLTDSKDKHSAILTNRIINELLTLVKICEIIILCGNHDFIDKNNPYFTFLNQIDSPEHSIRFVVTPHIIDYDLFIPNQFNIFEILTGIKKADFEKINNLFLHHPFVGSKVNSFYKLEEANDINKFEDIYKGRCFSGDIHIPQLCKNVEYVGSPYQISFGEDGKNRVIILNGEKQEDRFFPTIRKISLDIFSIEELQEHSLNSKDKVKIIYNIKRCDLSKKNDIQAFIVTFCFSKQIEIVKLTFKIIKEFGEIDRGSNIIEKVKGRSIKQCIKHFCDCKKLPNNYKETAINLIKE